MESTLQENDCHISSIQLGTSFSKYQRLFRENSCERLAQVRGPFVNSCGNVGCKKGWPNYQVAEKLYDQHAGKSHNADIFRPDLAILCDFKKCPHGFFCLSGNHGSLITFWMLHVLELDLAQSTPNNCTLLVSRLCMVWPLRDWCKKNHVLARNTATVLLSPYTTCSSLRLKKRGQNTKVRNFTNKQNRML